MTPDESVNERVQRTRARILEAFLRLAVERGIDSTPTRLVAEEAGVSELTLFRHFGDKATLVRSAIRHAAPTEQLRAYDPEIDASTPERAAASLSRCLRFLRDEAVRRQDLFHLAMSEARRHPELKDELITGPRQAVEVLQYALRQAAPQLREDVDARAAVISLQGLLLLTVLWTLHGWMRLDLAEWDELLEAAVRVLVRSPAEAPVTER
jgi:AcrR family transcriptional regulator